MKEKFNIFKKNKKLQNQIISFIVVGGIATVIDFAVLYIFNSLLGVDKYIANAISFTVSVTYNYWASCKFVFDVDKSKSKTTNFIVFIVLSIVGLGINEIFLKLGVDLLHMSTMIGKLFATVFTMIYNFITRKLFLEKH